MTLVVRDAVQEDFTQWEPLWDGYTRFYQREPEAGLTATTWQRLFDPAEPMHVLVAEQDGRLLGIAHYLYHRSTSMIGLVCYLQDLFTAADARGKGVGRALIEAVYEKARAAGSPRVYWLTHETNLTAMRLYDGLADKPGFVQYRKSMT